VTTQPTRRPDGLRYEIEADDQTWWELGWDPALGTYYAQLWRAEGDIQVADWHGSAPGELQTVAAVESAIGRAVPSDIRVELDADRTAAALRQGLQT
jgi:hypothetical protein